MDQDSISSDSNIIDREKIKHTHTHKQEKDQVRCLEQEANK